MLGWFTSKLMVMILIDVVMTVNDDREFKELLANFDWWRHQKSKKRLLLVMIYSKSYKHKILIDKTNPYKKNVTYLHERSTVHVIIEQNQI